MNISYGTYLKSRNILDSTRIETGKYSFADIDMPLIKQVCPTYRQWWKPYFSPEIRKIMEWLER